MIPVDVYNAIIKQWRHTIHLKNDEMMDIQYNKKLNVAHVCGRLTFLQVLLQALV